MRPLSVLAAILLLPAASLAQQVGGAPISLKFDEPEAWAMKFFSSITLFAGEGAAPELALGALVLTLEVQNIPKLDPRQRTVGFGGTKQEDLNKLPVFVRPRLTLGLPAQFSLTLAVVPPVVIAGVRPSLIAASLGRPLIVGHAFQLGFRVYGQMGDLEGDFTCSEQQVAAGTDAQLNPFACELPSRDRVTLNHAGVELGGGYRFARAHGLTPYVLVSGNYLDSTFSVNARYDGLDDRTTLRTHGFTAAVVTGLKFPFTSDLSASLQVFYSPLSVRRPDTEGTRFDGLVNGRFHVDWQLH